MILGIEQCIMELKIMQYASPRYQTYSDICKIPAGHPNHLEPPAPCNDVDCKSCEGFHLTRDWCNRTFQAQHGIVSRAESDGKLYLQLFPFPKHK